MERMTGCVSMACVRDREMRLSANCHETIRSSVSASLSLTPLVVGDVAFTSAVS